jgi:glucosamine-phosphate N-acetyltransferase
MDLKFKDSINNRIFYCNFMEFIKSNQTYIQEIKQSYLELLSNLTKTPDISTSLFLENIQEIEKSNGLITIAYVGDISANGFVKDLNNPDNNFKIIGSGTVILEPKIIRSGKYVGHIEDIVIDPNFRGLHIAQTILSILKSYSETKNCYKVILDCDPNLQTFYEKNDFELKGIQMAKYF